MSLVSSTPGRPRRNEPGLHVRLATPRGFEPAISGLRGRRLHRWPMGPCASWRGRRGSNPRARCCRPVPRRSATASPCDASCLVRGAGLEPATSGVWDRRSSDRAPRARWSPLPDSNRDAMAAHASGACVSPVPPRGGLDWYAGRDSNPHARSTGFSNRRVCRSTTCVRTGVPGRSRTDTRPLNRRLLSPLSFRYEIEANSLRIGAGSRSRTCLFRFSGGCLDRDGHPGFDTHFLATTIA